LANDTIAHNVEQSVAHQLESRESDPHDTHPPLPDRIAAIEPSATVAGWGNGGTRHHASRPAGNDRTTIDRATGGAGQRRKAPGDRLGRCTSSSVTAWLAGVGQTGGGAAEGQAAGAARGPGRTSRLAAGGSRVGFLDRQSNPGGCGSGISHIL